MSYIDDIFVMDDIFIFEQDVQQKFNTTITNVSYWNSSAAFQKQMQQVLQLPAPSLPWDYYYTYSITEQDRQHVLTSLGVPTEQKSDTMGLLLQSSTIAIVNIINLLIHFGKKKLCILQPAYFSVASCCAMFSLEYGFEHISFHNGQVQIPVERILSGGYDCVWITSPVFCTGYYFDSAQIKNITQLKTAGLTLVMDESLALPGKELIRSIPITPDVFAIYSPHKAISINGVKFAVLVCGKCYEDFLEQWVDVFSGALASSNRDAVFHYISPNYLKKCYPAYQAYISAAKVEVERIVKQFSTVSMLSNTEGHYINIFTDIQIHNTQHLLNMMHNVILGSMASFIPGTLNGFNSEQGLCFRVNLTGDLLEVPGAVGRILTYLDSHRHEK